MVATCAGIAMGCHNHDIEFQRGGGDPVARRRWLKDRLPVLHMKDYVIDADRQSQMTPIGAGNLDWPAICGAADQAGCRWYVVEHDNGTFESLEASFRYISENLCS